MSETLVYNVGKIQELKNTLANRLNEFNDAVDAMFKIIDTQMGQGDHWTGTTYNDLKDKCDNFRTTRIESMVSSLQTYIDHFQKTSTEAEETTASVIKTVTDDVAENGNITSQISGSFNEIGNRI